MAYFMKKPLELRLYYIERWASERRKRAMLRGDHMTALRAAELETRAHNYDTENHPSAYRDY